MTQKLLDERLTEILSGPEYQNLAARAEQAYARIRAEAPAQLAADVADLVAILQEVETRLLDERQAKGTAWAQGTMATLA